MSSPTQGVVAQRPAPAVDAFVTRSMGLTAADSRAIERGEPVVRVLPATEDRDIAVFGIVVVKQSRATLASALANYPAALHAPGRTLGILDGAPKPTDFSGVVVSSRESKKLRECRIGSCDFKLAATDMAAVRALIRGNDDSVQASAFERRRLARVAAAYLQTGNAGMPVYDDFSNKSVRGDAAFSALLASAPNLYAYAPGLSDYLAGYPRIRLDAAQDVLYWARDELSGLQPITTINHRIVYTPKEITGVTVVATKQILANHYLEAGLEVMVIVDRSTASPSAYLMFLRQYRFDQMPRAFMFSLRGRVTSKLRERAKAELVRFRSGGSHD